MQSTVHRAFLTLGFVVLLASIGYLAIPYVVRATPAPPSSVASAVSPVLNARAVPAVPRETGKVVLNETSVDGPTVYFNHVAWTGTDPAHRVNVQYTTHFPAWPYPESTKATLGETAIGGLQMGYRSGPVVFWTGTDAAHHLNLATLGL